MGSESLIFLKSMTLTPLINLSTGSVAAIFTKIIFFTSQQTAPRLGNNAPTWCVFFDQLPSISFNLLIDLDFATWHKVFLSNWQLQQVSGLVCARSKPKKDKNYETGMCHYQAI